MREHHKNNDLHNSYWAGIFGCMMTGFTQDYFAPFVLLLGGSAFHVGILNSINHLLSSLTQPLSANLATKFQSRRSVVLSFNFLQIISLLVLTLFAINIAGNIYAVIILIACFSAFGSMTHPCWVSILSDLVNAKQRGEYFGWRARNLGFITIAITFAAGGILYIFNHYHPSVGFAIIFGLAWVSRIYSFLSVKKMTEPPLTMTKEADFSFWDFFRQVRSSNFAKFVLFIAGVNFSVNLAAPYFAVYMLEDLSFNYLLYTLINITAPIALYSSISRWGKHADKVGNLKILKIVAPLFSVIPLLWIISQNILFLIFAEIVAGFLWAGFNLCSSNFIIDAVTPQKRTRCIAYFSVINGLALAAGALIGGQLLHVLPPTRGYKILTLFLISSVFRLILGLIMPRSLKEVRSVENVSSKQLLFSMIGLKPIAGIERKSIQL